MHHLMDHYFGKNEPFNDLKHGCMHEQAFLIRQVSGSYTLKGVEKKQGCHRCSPKCTCKLITKATRVKA